MPEVRPIDANAVVTIQVFDEMTEEYNMETITVAKAIDRWSDEGCPPTIDAVEVVHGRWNKSSWGVYRCSVCGGEFGGCGANGWSYCPNCGAKMDLKP